MAVEIVVFVYLKALFSILKGQHHERSKNHSQRLHSSRISLDWSKRSNTIIYVGIQTILKLGTGVNFVKLGSLYLPSLYSDNVEPYSDSTPTQPVQPVEADSIVMITVLCSSLDGVPLK